MFRRLPALAALATTALTVLSTPTHAQTDWSDDIALARQALEMIHPGYDRYEGWQQRAGQWDALSRQAETGMSREDFYLGLSLILADIRCEHTKAELPDALEALRDTQPVYLPFRFVTFDRRMYVDHPGETGLVRGTEILTLDGVSAYDRLAAVEPYLPVDGYTEHVRRIEMARTGEFMGSGFDHFDPLINPDDDSVTLTYRTPDGETGEITAGRLTFPQFLQLGSDGRRYRNFSEPGMVTTEILAEGVARLNVETFVNYRTPVDPDAVYGPVFEQLSADGIDTLIVDLRRNGGGSTDAQQGLMRHLIREPVTPIAELRVDAIEFGEVREHLSTWDQNALNPPARAFTQAADGTYRINPVLVDGAHPLMPAEHAFQGEIIILTGPTNASGATQIIGALREAANVTLVGEATGGAQTGPTAGVIFFLTLPKSEIVVRVPWQWAIPDITDADPRRGFQPDIYAPDTFESWNAGLDPALEAALAAATRLD